MLQALIESDSPQLIICLLRPQITGLRHGALPPAASVAGPLGLRLARMPSPATQGSLLAARGPQWPGRGRNRELRPPGRLEQTALRAALTST